MNEGRIRAEPSNQGTASVAAMDARDPNTKVSAVSADMLIPAGVSAELFHTASSTAPQPAPKPLAADGPGFPVVLDWDIGKLLQWASFG